MNTNIARIESPDVRPDRIEGARQMAQPTSTVNVGIDDGFAYTKLALPDGRLLALPSRAQIGCAKVSWIDNAERRIFEYATDGTTYSVGDVDAAPTRFEGYACSGMNRAIVQHSLQEAGLAGADVAAVSGLPVAEFYRSSGTRRTSAIREKQENLLFPVQPKGPSLPTTIVFHRVMPEALAAWYDYIIDEKNGDAQLDQRRVSAPVAVVDVGGRTTDTVVVRDQGIVHGSSGSLQFGMLDVRQALADALQERFDLHTISDRLLTQALQLRRLRLYGRDHDVSSEVAAAKQELVERLYVETRRQLGRAIELDRVLLVGGGTVALAEHMSDWFPNQLIAEQPAFANARGMLKYLQYVCDKSDAAF